MLEKISIDVINKNPSTSAKLLLAYRSDESYKKTVYTYGPYITQQLTDIPSIIEKVNLDNTMDVFDTMCIHRYVGDIVSECVESNPVASQHSFQQLLDFEKRLMSADDNKSVSVIRANTIAFVHGAIEGVITAIKPTSQYAEMIRPLNANIKSFVDTSKLSEVCNTDDAQNVLPHDDHDIDQFMDQYFSSIFSVDGDSNMHPVYTITDLNICLEALTNVDANTKLSMLAKVCAYTYQSDKKTACESYIHHYLMDDILNIPSDELMPLVEAMLTSSDIDVDNALSRSYTLDATIQKAYDDAGTNDGIELDEVRAFLSMHQEYEYSQYAANLFITQHDIVKSALTVVNGMLAIQNYDGLRIPLLNLIDQKPYILMVKSGGGISIKEMN